MKKIIGVTAFLLVLLGVVLPSTHTAQAERSDYLSFDGGVAFQSDHFYDYDSVATVNTSSGANLYNGNDSNKKYIKTLPNNTRWKVFGYTKRSDGFYYWAGGDQWIQAKSTKIYIENSSDAVLAYAVKYGETEWTGYRFAYEITGNNYWGSKYWIVGDATILAPGKDYGLGLIYANGDIFDASTLSPNPAKNVI